MGIFTRLLGSGKNKANNVRRLGQIGEEAKALRADPDAAVRATRVFRGLRTEEDEPDYEIPGLEQINDISAWDKAPDEDVITRALGEQPQGEVAWIPATSSWVDCFRYEPSEETPGHGKLWVGFRKGPPWRTNLVARGFYENMPESLYDDMFSAGSFGEFIHDQLYRKQVYTLVDFSEAIGTWINWPRQGSRGGDLGPAGSWWDRHTGRRAQRLR